MHAADESLHLSHGPGLCFCYERVISLIVQPRDDNMTIFVRSRNWSNCRNNTKFSYRWRGDRRVALSAARRLGDFRFQLLNILKTSQKTVSRRNPLQSVEFKKKNLFFKWSRFFADGKFPMVNLKVAFSLKGWHVTCWRLRDVRFGHMINIYAQVRQAPFYYLFLLFNTKFYAQRYG